MREVYEENLALHERMAELQSRLEKSIETRHDLDNLCARVSESCRGIFILYLSFV